MFNWLHHLFTPHCDQCNLEKHYIAETLKLLLEQERAEKFRLLQLLAPSQQVSYSPQQEAIDLSGLRRNPKAVMRELERKSFEEATKLRQRNLNEQIQNLEELAGVENNG